MIPQALDTFPSSSASLSNDSFLRVLCGKAVIFPPVSGCLAIPNLLGGPGGRFSAATAPSRAPLSENYRTTSDGEGLPGQQELSGGQAERGGAGVRRRCGRLEAPDRNVIDREFGAARALRPERELDRVADIG